MVQEILQLVGSVWPDDKGVVHVAKLAEGLLRGQIKGRLLKGDMFLQNFGSY
jgi:hypothetical protein